MKTKMIALRKRNVRGTFIAEPIEERFWRSVQKKGDEECWEWNGTRHYKGYGEFALPKGSIKYREKAHRMAWILTYGKIKNGMLVCHHCDNPPCCNPKHLFIGTAKTNSQDCANKRRTAHGERSPKAKLTEQKVREIRMLDKQGLTRLSIGAKFGISGRSVTAVCRRESWSHVF